MKDKGHYFLEIMDIGKPLSHNKIEWVPIHLRAPNGKGFDCYVTRRELNELFPPEEGANKMTLFDHLRTNEDL